jgi:hypothetical protein
LLGIVDGIASEFGTVTKAPFFHPDLPPKHHAIAVTALLFGLRLKYH